MKERRSLVDGMSLQQDNRVDRRVEDDFVREGKPTPAGSTAVQQEPTESKQQNAGKIPRLPLSTRIRADYATALKQESLKRQQESLKGQWTAPDTMQGILEEALEPWMVANGYINPPRR